MRAGRGPAQKTKKKTSSKKKPRPAAKAKAKARPAARAKAKAGPAPKAKSKARPAPKAKAKARPKVQKARPVATRERRTPRVQAISTPPPWLALASLKARRPTERWRRTLAAGDELFTPEGIAASEALLHDYLEDLARLSGAPDEQAIVARVEQVVRDLNALGGYDQPRFGNFLNTDEREELVPWLLDAARAAGWAGQGDITEPWREW